jgi:hypothetical protein
MDTGLRFAETGRTPTHQNRKILKTDEFYRKKLWLLLIDAPKWPKVSRLHSTRTIRAEDHQESGQDPRNALSYKDNGIPSRDFVSWLLITRHPGTEMGTTQFAIQAQNTRSRLRYWIASAMCLGSIAPAPSRSATVLATFRIRS